jgi:hypothetical protein
MIDPSGIRLPKGEEFRIKEVKKGLFIVENAFEGEYEYFDGRPMFRVERNPEPADPIFEDYSPASAVPSFVPAFRAVDFDVESD